MRQSLLIIDNLKMFKCNLKLGKKEFIVNKSIHYSTFGNIVKFSSLYFSHFGLIEETTART